MVIPHLQYPKSSVNKAGEILMKKNSTIDQREDALVIIDNWRACHAYPLNTFQSTLRSRLKKHNFSGAFAAERLKRMTTILNKLSRYPDMQLSRMQDIGGLRAIVSSIKDVHELEMLYLTDKKMQHKLVGQKDYIEDPKPDGYRSVHLIYKYKNKRKPEYNGLRVELQIRTKLQHAWATAVETMGTYMGHPFKSGEGEKVWRDFFAIASSAFAYQEKTKPVSQYAQLSKDETYKLLSKKEKQINALDTMEGYNLALQVVFDRRGKRSYYHLIILDYKKKVVDVKSFAKNEIKNATQEYAKIEKEVAKTENKIEAVLVSAGDLNSLKRAYPNYFLDMNKFVKGIRKITNPSL